jgi:regulator of protease activity HflC (stomatin/prohibitin superfamily)
MRARCHIPPGLGWAAPKPKGAGLILDIWPVERLMRLDLRTITKVIEPQDIIARGKVSVRANAVLDFRVVDLMRSVREHRMIAEAAAADG